MKPRSVLPIAFVFLILISLGFYFLLKKEVSEVQSPAQTEEIKKEGKSEEGATSVTEAAVPAPSLVHPELQVLAEIFKSKNDNDPRMDRELKNLSEPVKAALRVQYAGTKMELRNERGTIAFLIGRELKEGRGSQEDVKFLASILMEKPCLSLVDCSKAPTSESPEEQHLGAIHETTAQYPQLMDLRALRQSLEGGNLTPELRASVVAALESARNSPNPRVVMEARKILESLPKN